MFFPPPACRHAYHSPWFDFLLRFTHGGNPCRQRDFEKAPQSQRDSVKAFPASKGLWRLIPASQGTWRLLALINGQCDLISFGYSRSSTQFFIGHLETWGGSQATGIDRGRNLAGAGAGTGTKLNQPGPGLTGILKCCRGRGRGRDWLQCAGAGAGAGIFLL